MKNINVLHFGGMTDKEVVQHYEPKTPEEKELLARLEAAIGSIEELEQSEEKQHDQDSYV
jgi:hypothetical protein